VVTESRTHTAFNPDLLEAQERLFVFHKDAEVAFTLKLGSESVVAQGVHDYRPLQKKL